MEALDQQIRDAVADIPGVTVLVLFGSRARGNPRPDSDLDVAVLLDPAIQRLREGLRDDPRIEIAVALAGLSPAPNNRVDVVLLDEAPDTLRQKVMVEGRMILCRDPDAWQALRVRTMKEYGDREWARRLYRQGLVRRLREGRFGSGRPECHRQPFERARRLSRQAGIDP